MTIKIGGITVRNSGSALVVSGENLRWFGTVECNACHHVEATIGEGAVRSGACPKCGSTDVTLRDVVVAASK